MQPFNTTKFGNWWLPILLSLLPLFINAQSKPKILIKEGDTLRLASTSKKMVDATITFLVPTDRDTTNKKKNFFIQDSLKKGKLLVELDQKATTADRSKIALPVKSEFEIDTLKKQNEFRYTIRVPRDSLDDRQVVLNITAKDAKGKLINQTSKKFIIYIKPLISDTLGGSDKLELWFHTGTNFDLFNGVKAQEFFFRANMLLKITGRFYAQVAFYKNRYFLDGQNNEEVLTFNSVKQPVQFGETLYTFTSGTYKRSTKQTTDPLAWQLDALYKITDDKNSNFFLSGGWDISTTTVSIENSYTYLDTTFRLQTSKPDTLPGSKNFGTTNFPRSFKYDKPSYNFNVGFMWIFNDETLNVKTQLVGGISSYSNLLYRQETKGGTQMLFEAKSEVYLQTRVMATYKPLGISFGMESFMRKSDVPAFNFTLSKAFDLKKLVSNFTPVSGLKIQ